MIQKTAMLPSHFLPTLRLIHHSYDFNGTTSACTLSVEHDPAYYQPFSFEFYCSLDKTCSMPETFIPSDSVCDQGCNASEPLLGSTDPKFSASRVQPPFTMNLHGCKSPICLSGRTNTTSSHIQSHPERQVPP